ncbi:MAG: glycerol-3-phosphate acyltransferase, partial [Desulfobacterales bacterium]|nr:glycerol-3-phosphate acyltransferase [Desulfobacterales bacterium]
MKTMNLLNIIQQWILYIIDYTKNNYICYLPKYIGRLSSFMLKLFFSGITVNDIQVNTIQSLKDEGNIVYVSKYKSNFEFLFYYSRFKTDGLPFPVIGLDYKIYLWQPVTRLLKNVLFYTLHYLKHFKFPSPYHSEFIQDNIREGNPCFMSLIGAKSFYSRFIKHRTDPVQYLIEVQKTMDRPIYLVPQIMFFSVRPHKTHPSLLDIIIDGNQEKPGKIRRLIALFNKPNKIFIEFSTPVNLKTFLSSPDIENLSVRHQAFALRRSLLKQINRHRQSITGPILKSRQEIKETILTTDRLQYFMEKHANETNTKIKQIHKKAVSYVMEIAANYSLNWIKSYEITLDWLIKTMFDGIMVDQQSLSKVKEMSQKGSLI